MLASNRHAAAGVKLRPSCPPTRPGNAVWIQRETSSPLRAPELAPSTTATSMRRLQRRPLRPVVILCSQPPSVPGSAPPAPAAPTCAAARLALGAVDAVHRRRRHEHGATPLAASSKHLPPARSLHASPEAGDASALAASPLERAALPLLVVALDKQRAEGVDQPPERRGSLNSHPCRRKMWTAQRPAARCITAEPDVNAHR